MTMAKLNRARLRQIYHAIYQHPGSKVGDIARLTGLEYGQVLCSLIAMNNNDFLITEDPEGRLYVFDYYATFTGGGNDHQATI